MVMLMSVSKNIEKVLAQTSNCKLSPEEKKELAEAITKALLVEFYIFGSDSRHVACSKLYSYFKLL